MVKVPKTNPSINLPQKVNNGEFNNFIDKKLDQVIDIIQRTYLSLEYCKQYDIFTKTSVGQCTDHLHTIYELANDIKVKMPISETDMNGTLTIIQTIFDKLSVVFSTYGTYSINDIYYVVFGTKYNSIDSYDKENAYISSKLALIEKYLIPVGYKNLPWKEVEVSDEDIMNKITSYTIQIDKSSHLECFEPSTMYSSVHQSVYGLRTVIRNSEDKKLLCVSGLVKDIPLQYLQNNEYVKIRLSEIETVLLEHESNKELVQRFIESITLKELLIFSNLDFSKKFEIMKTDIDYVKNNKVENIVKKFFEMETNSRRKMLVNLLIYNLDNEVQYIAYMLYDLLGANENTENTDTTEQTILYETLPWKLKQYFKETMINTIEFTQNALESCDTSKISLEQQVLLMKAEPKIKDKALMKLKEVKSRSDDQGSKSKQYLEALVKIPFGIFRKEPILCKMDSLNDTFKNMSHMIDANVQQKNKYTLYEIKSAVDDIDSKSLVTSIEECKSKLSKKNKTTLTQLMNIFVNTIPKEDRNKESLLKHLRKYLDNANTDKSLKKEVYEALNIINPSHININIHKQLTNIHDELHNVDVSMKKIKDDLDDCIYGHDEAKRQILKIVGQWINGEQKGYCFGFEGSPGVGKTSLAKRGLASCLEDENGVHRPFSFIALGGSSNGSTLEGHNYTYVNSTWGKVVDVLMESKCMNPIIYIDELDKVSKTEQGREIIGILTHLIDGTQNDEFQDRFFSGIPFDLSKALFIFSYNDPNQIDRILLDRIHRIRFDNLSWTDKIVIVDKFIKPELNEKMGFDNTVNLSEEVVKYIIETYTMEPGVRKLKEILFDLYGEINLTLLDANENDDVIELPVNITIEDLGTKFLKKNRKVSDMKIHKEPIVGTMNGMWANALGKGGIIPIETRFFPASNFLDLKLTGMQGDVMKESMTVAKTLAWSLTPPERQKELMKQFEETKNQGIHIHCPEGAVNKDGPSAGGAITSAIYSLLNNKPINNTVSMTGETNLRGRITAIGGLDSKILGSIRAGVRTILYPVENEEDFQEFLTKYNSVLDLKEITFHAVDHIDEVLKHIFE